MNFELNIASPGKERICENIDRVIIKLVEGNVEILANHVPFISLIKNGYVKYNDQEINIESGVVHLQKNKMYITYFK